MRRGCLVLLTVLLAACSVKEDRADCPCELRLFLACPEALSLSDSLRLSTGTWRAEKDSVAFGRCRRMVPRRKLRIEAWRGDGGNWSPRSGLRIPEGSAWPPLWLASAPVDCRADFRAVSLPLRREHTLLSVTLSTAGYSALLACSDWNGCSVTGEPLRGPFRCKASPTDAPRETEAHVWTVRLPRQGDASLRMELQKAGRTVQTFALGEPLRESSYDWSAPVLEDISLRIDFAATSVTLSRDAWSRTVELETVI